jgi:hypothetical protein
MLYQLCFRDSCHGNVNMDGAAHVMTAHHTTTPGLILLLVRLGGKYHNVRNNDAINREEREVNIHTIPFL